MATLTFREQVSEDFQNVFLNQEEFGRECLWNGVKIRLVVVADSGSVLGESYAAGVARAGMEVYCRSEDLPAKPLPTQVVDIDGERWIVVEAQTLYGHYRIALAKETA